VRYISILATDGVRISANDSRPFDKHVLLLLARPRSSRISSVCTVQLRDFDEEKRRRAAGTGRFDQSGRRRPGEADQGPTSERAVRKAVSLPIDYASF